MAMCVYASRFASTALCALAIVLSACGSDDRGEQPAADGGGQAASTGETGGGGGASGAGGVGAAGGESGIGGAAGAGGAGGGAAGTGAAGASAHADAAIEYPRDGAIYDGNLGPIGTLPPGAICANDLNCSQDQGPAVCCVNVCRPAEDCPGGSYLQCVSGSDCDAFGGGKVCCDVPGMRFCTKPSACEGEVIR